MKCSRGPWYVGRPNAYGLCAVHDVNDMVVAEDQTPSDARLIAAAPELLDALKLWDYGCMAPDVTDCRCHCCITRAAIAKAEGR